MTKTAFRNLPCPFAPFPRLGLAAGLAAALQLAGCDRGPAPAAVAAAPAIRPEATIATVNGHPIAKSALSSQQRGPVPSAMQNKLLDDLIAREVIRQEFEQQHLAQDPEAVERIDNVLRVTYSQLAAERYMKSVQITDEELKKAYEDKYPPNHSGEYKARHILLAEEAEAKDAIAQLQGGAKFDELARKLSKDPGSKNKGGDLGWFEPQRMDPAFAAGVAALKNGETGSQPVHSKFGWHVILREDSRDKKPPTFDSEKERLRNGLKMERFQQHIEQLKQAAKVERKPAALPPPAQPAPQLTAPPPAPQPPAAPPATSPASPPAP
jgi:peptidyl-prolyl cis-trans isomerase C